jgi:hypothetical protein
MELPSASVIRRLASALFCAKLASDMSVKLGGHVPPWQVESAQESLIMAEAVAHVTGSLVEVSSSSFLSSVPQEQIATKIPRIIEETSLHPGFLIDSLPFLQHTLRSATLCPIKIRVKHMGRKFEFDWSRHSFFRLIYYNIRPTRF